MEKAKSDLMYARIRAEEVCFTPPEFRSARTSNLVGSVSAWEGCLRAVYGHPGTSYEIDWVGLLFQPRWSAITINEIQVFKKGGTDIEEDKTLRTTAFLQGYPKRETKTYPMWPDEVKKVIFAGVDYVVAYRLVGDAHNFSERLGHLKHRIKSDRCFRQPYLGLKESMATIIHLNDPTEVNSWVDGFEGPIYEHPNGLKTVKYSSNLGNQFYGTDYESPGQPFYQAPLVMTNGIVIYPSWDEVRKIGMKTLPKTSLRRGKAK